MKLCIPRAIVTLGNKKHLLILSILTRYPELLSTALSNESTVKSSYDFFVDNWTLLTKQIFEDSYKAAINSKSFKVRDKAREKLITFMKSGKYFFANSPFS